MRKVVVQGRTPGAWVDLSQSATYTVSGERMRSCARRRRVLFCRDGRTSLGAWWRTVRKRRSTLRFRADGPRPISYVRDIMPILGKAGCNSGSCHGGQKGKAGFKLSLRGYDPEWDHEQLIEDLSSRRFNRSRPADSLILLKPTNEVPHEGGQRFGPDSVYYRMLHQWIVEGNKSDMEKTTRAKRLEVFPPANARRAGDDAGLSGSRVRRRFDPRRDARRRDTPVARHHRQVSLKGGFEQLAARRDIDRRPLRRQLPRRGQCCGPRRLCGFCLDRSARSNYIDELVTRS